MAKLSSKVLVTGAAGMLGKDVVAELGSDSNFTVIGAVRCLSPLFSCEQVIVDLQSSDEIRSMVSAVKPDYIVHCAAITDLDLCENDRDKAHKVNVEAAYHLVSSKSASCRFIYISTDSVFNGDTGNYSEKAVPSPLNYYAETKFLGERAVLEIDRAAVVLRTNIYGFHVPKGKSLVEWAVENLANGISIKGFDDVFFNPLSTLQLAGLIRQILLKQNISGTIHLGCEENVSKYEFLRRLAVTFGFNPELVIRSSSTSVQFKTKRPLDTTLNTGYLHKLTGETYSLADGLKRLQETYPR